MPAIAQLTAHVPFRVLCVCCALLVVKMLALGFYTGVVRRRHRAYLNPEDTRFGGKGIAPQADEHPLVQRILRAHRNDLENILPFFTVGLLYVLCGATALGAQAYFITFTVARIFHTWCYLAGIQPWRTINHTVGLACLLGMLAHVVIATV